MKRLIYVFLVLAGLSSCDDFLTEDLKGDYNSTNILSNEEQAQLAVNAIYNAAAYSINLWKFGDIASDDAVKGGNDGDQAEIGYIDDFTAQSDNGVIAEFWQNTYETISRANNVIDGIKNTPMDATKKEQMIAEAKFLRAYSYFQLVNIFGEVPLKLYPQNSDKNIYVGLSSVEGIYTQIEKDLTDAVVLPVSYAVTETGRATRGAAYGLLAKAQLYQKKYGEALTSIQNLESLNLYDLDSYENLFKLGNENSIETIFAICFLSNQVPTCSNALNQWLAPSIESGYFFDNPTQSWVDIFTEKQTDGTDDLRLDASIGRDGKAWLNDNTFSSSWSSTGYLVKKHNQPLTEVDAGRKGDGGLAYIYLRYADILLMKAECQNELHHPDLAEAPLNRVRNRAGLADISGKTESEMRSLIRTERRKELGFEFHRFFDLMRWGKEVATEALGPEFTWTEPRYYFPLPQTELDSNLGIK